MTGFNKPKVLPDKEGIDVTATFGIPKGNIQSVLTLVIRDTGGRRGNNHTFYGDVPLKD
jgi:hypothetical protein